MRRLACIDLKQGSEAERRANRQLAAPIATAFKNPYCSRLSNVGPATTSPTLTPQESVPSPYPHRQFLTDRRPLCRGQERAVLHFGMSSLHLLNASMAAWPVTSAWLNTSTLDCSHIALHHHILSSSQHHHRSSCSVAERLSTDTIEHIVSTLVHCYALLQLWVGQFLFYRLRYFNSTSTAVPSIIMAIADVLFLPWPSWAKLAFVSDETQHLLSALTTLIGPGRTARCCRFYCGNSQDHEMATIVTT